MAEEEIKSLIKFYDYLDDEPREEILSVDDMGEYPNFREIFDRLRMELPQKENCNIELFCPEPEENKIIEESEDYFDQLIFEDDYPITEINEEKIKVISFNCFFREKYRLVIYFYANKDSFNDGVFSKIKSYFDYFLTENPLFYLDITKAVIIYTNKIQKMQIEKNDVLIVFCSARFIKDVISQSEQIYSILILTSDNYLETVKNEYSTQMNVKKVGVKIHELLKDEFFTKELI